MVVIPTCLIVGYLVFRATDQYASEMSFSIRSEEFVNPLDALAGLGQLSTGTTSDADIVYEFIGSQKIVRSIDSEIGLRKIYSSAEGDPVFTISPDVSIEGLVAHWRRMVHVSYDKGSGLIHVTSFAFDPKSAEAVNKAILSESQQLVDKLSMLARDDATKYAEADLNEARKRLKIARQNLSRFRAESRIIDPTIDVQSQGGVSAALQQQLAEALIDRDLLRGSTSNVSDPRIEQADRRIQAIEQRLEGERESLSSGVDRGMVTIVGNYEALTVEREFAEQAFLSAAAAYDSAKAEAKRRTKYLAVHIEPTVADTPLYPRKLLIIAVSAVLLILIWAVLVMVAYSVRDRR
jgi:capsular polysaccharide transport system permease protein